MDGIWLYRGIKNGKKIWNGLPNGRSVQAPEEEGYYDVYELVNSDNSHDGFRWEESQYTEPEVFFDMKWYPVPDSYWR